MNSIKIGIVRCGCWRPNLIDTFASYPQTGVIAICDTTPSAGGDRPQFLAPDSDGVAR